MRRQMREEADRVKAIEDGSQKVRMGGRGLLAFSEDGLGETTGGTAAKDTRTLGGMAG